MLAFIRREIVFVIAAVAAVITAFFNPPSMAWIEGIDFRTLALLFSLMGVSEGLKSSGFFDAAAGRMMKSSGSFRTLSFLLVAIVFFSSMFFTNDVSLLMFVPFTMMLFDKEKIEEKYIIRTVVIETIAANLGSMTTPVGNPQNLYICSDKHSPEIIGKWRQEYCRWNVAYDLRYKSRGKHRLVSHRGFNESPDAFDASEIHAEYEEGHECKKKDVVDSLEYLPVEDNEDDKFRYEKKLPINYMEHGKHRNEKEEKIEKRPFLVELPHFPLVFGYASFSPQE